MFKIFYSIFKLYTKRIFLWYIKADPISTISKMVGEFAGKKLVEHAHIDFFF